MLIKNGCVVGKIYASKRNKKTGRVEKMNVWESRTPLKKLLKGVTLKKVSIAVLAILGFVLLLCLILK